MVYNGYIVLGKLPSLDQGTDTILGMCRYDYTNDTGSAVYELALPVSFQAGTLLIVERQTCYPGIHYTEDLENKKIIVTPKATLKYDLIPKGAKCLLLYLPRY